MLKMTPQNELHANFLYPFYKQKIGSWGAISLKWSITLFWHLYQCIALIRSKLLSMVSLSWVTPLSHRVDILCQNLSFLASNSRFFGVASFLGPQIDGLVGWDGPQILWGCPPTTDFWIPVILTAPWAPIRGARFQKQHSLRAAYELFNLFRYGQPNFYW